jgi:hypothetical protein
MLQNFHVLVRPRIFESVTQFYSVEGMEEIQKAIPLCLQNGYAGLRQNCGGKIVCLKSARK